MRFLLAAVSITVSMGHVDAFDVMGLAGGMAIEDAQSLPGISLSPVPGMSNVYFVNGSNSGTNVTFCSGGLASVTQNITGGLDAFVSQAEQQQQVYGLPKTSTHQEYGTSGLVSQLLFEWMSSSNESVSLSLYSIDGALSSSVALTHSARHRICP